MSNSAAINVLRSRADIAMAHIQRSRSAILDLAREMSELTREIDEADKERAEIERTIADLEETDRRSQLRRDYAVGGVVMMAKEETDKSS